MTRQNLDGIDYELLNHEPDEALRSKIKALWALADVTIANPEQRLSEIRAVAWQGDLLVAVSSCAAVREPNTQQLLWDTRALVHPDYRAHKLVSHLFDFLIENLEQQWLSGRSPTVMGILLALEAVQFQNDGMPLSNTRVPPFPGSGKFFFDVGQMPNGARVMVCYFAGAKFCWPGEVSPRQSAPVKISAAALPSAFVYNNVDATLAEQLIQFWLDEGALSDREHCMSRLPQVAAVCRDGDAIAAVASIFPGKIEHLGAQLNVLRVFVGKRHRQRHLALGMVNTVFEGLNQSFKERRQLPQYPGMVFSIQNTAVGGWIDNADAPRTGFCLAGFDAAGNQLRLRWFDGATQGDRKQSGAQG